jgi:hypothetical protein
MIKENGSGRSDQTRSSSFDVLSLFGIREREEWTSMCELLRDFRYLDGWGLGFGALSQNGLLSSKSLYDETVNPGG